MKILKALIVEDEVNSQVALKNMLENFCSGVEVVGVAGTVDEAVKKINLLSPDLIFLDIELPEKNGFQLLEYFPENTFDIIFTTAYNEFAVKAFSLSAIDYLLKPIDLELLRKAILKAAEKSDVLIEREKFQLLKQNMNNVQKKLALPTGSGLTFVELSEIIRCQAEGNYTTFYFTNGKKLLVSKTLKNYENMLTGFNFYRINRKDLVNMNHVKEFRRQKKATVVTRDDAVLNLSDTRRGGFLDMIG